MKHSWAEKHISGGVYTIVCRDCGKDDMVSSDRNLIQARMRELTKNAASNHGLMRRMRKAKSLRTS